MRIIFKNVFSGLTAIVFVFLSTAAFAAQWKIVESSGVVRTTSPMAGATLVSTGNALNSGDILSTGFDGRVVLARGDQQIVVGPNSRMSLPAAEEPGMTRILQDIGTLLFKVDKRQEKHFRVETPVIAAVVKGTTFTVTAGAEAHAVHVAEGAVEVSTRNGLASELVTAGRTVRIDRNNPAAIRFSDTASRERGRETIDTIENSVGEREANDASEGGERLTVPSAIGAGPLDFATLTDGLVQSPQGQGPVVGLSRANAVAGVGAIPANAAADARLSATGNNHAARAMAATGNNANVNARGGNESGNAGIGNGNGGGNGTGNEGNANANGGANANANAGNGNANGGANANANAGNGNANSGANANANAGNGNANGGANANANAGNGNANANANANAGNGSANGGANANANAGNGSANGGANANANANAGNGNANVNGNVGNVNVNGEVNLNGNGNAGNGNGNGGGNGTGNEGNGNNNGRGNEE